MLQKVLLVVVVLSLLAVGGVTLLGNDDEPSLGSAHAELPAADPVSAAADTAAAPAGHAAEADARPADVANSARAEAAVFEERTQRPLPDDATWLEIKVVDKATQTPQPGALVHWFDDSAHQYLAEAKHPEQAQIHQLTWRAEYVADLAGWRTRTDQRGIARVTSAEGTIVAAQHGELYGRLVLRANTLPPQGGHVLELERDLLLTARVTDDTGAPCGGVPVTLAATNDKGEVTANLMWSLQASTRDEDGIVAIPHLQMLVGEHEQSGVALQWRVRAVLPGFPDPGVAFDARNPPATPVELRLPACGSLRVRAEWAGNPVPGFDMAWLNHDVGNDEEQYRAWRVGRPDTDGQIRFRHVPVGKEYDVNSNAIGGLHARAAGPRQRGQEVEVVLRPGDRAMLLAGRLLTTEQLPVAERGIMLRVQGPQLRQHASAMTDADGRFVCSVGDERKENRADQIWIELHRKGEAPQRVDIAGRTLRAGIEELGDLVMGEGAIILAGTIVAAGKPWTQPIQLTVQREEMPTEANANRRWRRLEGALQWKDDKGSFWIRGTAPPGRYRLAVSSERIGAMAPIEFTPGTKDFVLSLEAGHALLASVLLPDGAPAESLSFQLVPAAKPAAGKPDEVARDRLQRRIEASDKHRHHVHWSGLAAGEYTFEVTLAAAAKPLVTIPGISLPAPGNTDPRLVDIDLRAMLRVVALTLQSADGNAIEDGECMVFPAGQAQAAEWTGHHAWSQQPKVLLASGPYDLLVCVSGFRPHPLRGDASEATLRLERWPTLVVRIADVPKLPPKARLQVALQGAATNELRYRTPWSSGSRAELTDPPRRNVQVVDGRAEVPIGDGMFQVRLTLSANRRPHVIPTEPAQVLSTATEVTLTVAKEHWDKALEAAAAPTTPTAQPPR
jgi:hypothetical protein